MAFVNFDRRFLNDRFTEMSKEAQLFYFILNFHAQKGGKLLAYYSIARGYEISKSACEELLNKGYICELKNDPFYSHKIVDWDRNNDLSLAIETRSGYHYQQWKRKVKERDKCCQICGATENLVAHHIKSYRYYPELRYDLSNGITLCGDCHKEQHKSRKGGDYYGKQEDVQ